MATTINDGGDIINNHRKSKKMIFVIFLSSFTLTAIQMTLKSLQAILGRPWINLESTLDDPWMKLGGPPDGPGMPLSWSSYHDHHIIMIMIV